MVTAYQNNPRTDFHQMVADMAGIKRKAAKTIGLGLMYGMGKQKLANSLDLPIDEAEELIRKFHEKVPFLRGTVDAVMRRIEHRGSGGAIRTLQGRKCRFPLWEGATHFLGQKISDFDTAFVHGLQPPHGLNSVLQGFNLHGLRPRLVELIELIVLSNTS